MSTVRWTGGAATGVVSTGGNWSTGSVPAAADDVIIDVTNYDLSGTFTNAMTSLTITETFGGNIDVTLPATTTLSYSGSGATARFTNSGTVTTAYFNHRGTASLGGSNTWTTVENATGTLDLGTCIVVTLRNNGGTLTAGYNATAITTAWLMAGNHDISRTITTGHIAGRLVHRNSGSTTTSIATNFFVYPGGLYNKRSTGTDSAGKVFPGATFSPSGAAGNMTVTALEQWGGASVTLAAPGTTVTATITYVGVSTPGFPDVTP